MSEIEDKVKEVLEGRDDWPLNTYIAGMVAVVATFMAICNIKDGNIVQTMAQVQSKSVDSWSYYQAKSIKQLLSENSADQLRTQVASASALTPAAREMLEEKIAQLDGNSKRYGKEKDEIRQQAEGYEKEYERLNVHDDQFDMAEACFTVSIALFGVAALTRRKWLFGFACALSTVGFLLGFAGFLQWAVHPDWLAKLLG